MPDDYRVSDEMKKKVKKRILTFTLKHAKGQFTEAK
jgi:hypothetical protein